MKRFKNILFYTDGRRAAGLPSTGPWIWPIETRGG